MLILTEKRFRRFYNVVIDNTNNKKYDIEDCCKLLNELADENVQLKKCNSKAKNHIEDIIFLLNNTPSQTLSRDDLIILVQKTKEYLE